ncbi:glycosyltransferase family 2 protein, partial [Acidithiobacillus ferrooxidans]
MDIHILDDKNVDVSVVIPVFNKSSYTKSVVESLMLDTDKPFRFELIIVNDCSTDDTIFYLESLKNANDIAIIHNQQNYGFAKSVNIGVNTASGRYICLLNNDILLPNKNWLLELYGFIDSHKNVGCVGNVQYNSDGELDHAGVSVDKFGHVNHIKNIECSDKSEFKEIFAVTGACMVFARSIFELVGGFDEEYMNGGEDIDFCLKTATRGFVNYIVFSSEIIHLGSITRGVNNRRDDLNSYRLYSKWNNLLQAELSHNILQWISSGHNLLFDNSVVDDGVVVLLNDDLCTVVAYNLIQRHFERWNRELFGIKNALSIGEISQIIINKNKYTIYMEYIPYIKNIYAVGSVLKNISGVSLEIEIKGVMTKRFELQDKCFNIGIIAPFLMPGI